jgi:hypothetical protein
MCISLFGTCVVAVQLTSLSVGHDLGLPQTATSYDGEIRSISEFYEPERPTIKVGGDIYLGAATRISLDLDGGYQSRKLDIDPTLAIGVDHTIGLSSSRDHDLSLQVHGSVSIGGKQNHTSCVDSYDREYYCGNLTAWTDFVQHETANPYKVMLTLSYKF